MAPDTMARSRAEDNSSWTSSLEGVLKFFSILLVVITFPFSFIFCLKTVQEYERAIIFRLGRVKKGGVVGPGLFFILPFMDTVSVVDLRTISFDVPCQEILTSDSVTVMVDAVVYYNIEDAMAAICNVEQYGASTRLLASTTLRNTLGTKTLMQILQEKEAMAEEMQNILDTATDPWGIKVQRIEVKDVRLPAQMQRAMAAEAEADREARAKVVAADGERRAAVALREASDIMDQSSSALQLRYLQTLTSIAAERNSTIVFPVPVNLLAGMAARTEG